MLNSSPRLHVVEGVCETWNSRVWRRFTEFDQFWIPDRISVGRFHKNIKWERKIKRGGGWGLGGGREADRTELLKSQQRVRESFIDWASISKTESTAFIRTLANQQPPDSPFLNVRCKYTLQERKRERKKWKEKKGSKAKPSQAKPSWEGSKCKKIFSRKSNPFSGGRGATMTVLSIQTAQLLLWGRSTHWQKLGNK